MIDIKQKPSFDAIRGVKPTDAKKIDLSSIPQVSLDDVNACLKRSGAARSVHEKILHHKANRSQISASDLEGMLARAGVEKTDVKTVLAYHAHHDADCFSHEALHFLAGLDWTDVAAAHIDELKKQNADQVKGFAEFMAADRKLVDAERADRHKLRDANEQKANLQKKTPLELEADFAEETTKSGLNSKEAFLLLSHRRRFANND
ncbi:MAG TPA: hypothetical protein VGF99_20170 [Myxococcota bacterium]